MDYFHYPVENPNAPSLLKSQSTWMFAILLFQAIVCFFRITELFDVASGFFNGLTVLLGYYAWKNNMDITLVSLWGVANTFILFYDFVGSIGEGLMNLLGLKFVRVVLILAVPFGDYLASGFAWELFKDHERRGGTLKPLFAGAETIPIFAKYHGNEEEVAQAKQAKQASSGKMLQGAPGSSQEMQHPVDMLAAQQAGKARKQSSVCC